MQSYFTLLHHLARLVVLLGVSGCVHSPMRSPADVGIAVPEHWQSPHTQTSDEPLAWLTELGDEGLNTLLKEALAHNYDLAAAMARLRAQRATARIVGAPRFPQLSAGLGGSRTDSAAAKRRDNFSMSADVAWEVDVWGRLSAQAQSASYSAQAAAADLDAARLLLVANIAQSWFATTTAVQQFALAEQNLDNLHASVEITEQRYRQGLNTALDVRLARSSFANAQSQYYATQQAVADAKRGLEILLGRYPAGALTVAADLPSLQATIPSGVPVDVLTRRPDVRAARERVNAAFADVAAAQRNLLPRLSLTGNVQQGDNTFSRVFDLDNLIWTVAGNLTAPIFQGGKLSAERDQARASRDVTVADYGRIALNAFNEVETALHSAKTLNQQAQALSLAADESREAEVLANEQYGRGLVDIITLLEAQRRAVDAQRNVLQNRLARLQNRIQLHLALGGDFDLERMTVSLDSDTSNEAQGVPEQ